MLHFFENILQHKSISVVGLAKNAGKTECLNYILKELKNFSETVAITSIGIDGESYDSVSNLPKPEITIYEGMIFITSETHYRQKKFVSEILDISNIQTSLGRLIIAKALTQGKIILSGPADTASLKLLINSMLNYGANTTIVDGALSRLSPASPAVSEAMILSTGAAVSKNFDKLVRHTKYVYDLINLNLTDDFLRNKLFSIENGIWAVSADNQIYDLQIPSSFMLEKNEENIFRFGKTFFVSGAVSDGLLRFFKSQKHVNEIKIIIRDFTKIFVSEDNFYTFIKKGGKIEVLDKSKLLAVSINPTSPDGYHLNGDKLIGELQKIIVVPVFDVRKL